MNDQPTVSMDIGAMLEMLQAFMGLGNEVRILRAQAAQSESNVRQFRDALVAERAAANQQNAPVHGGSEE